MRTSLLCACLLLGIASILAADPFAGTWKMNVAKSQFPKKPERFELSKGVFKCSTCDPKVAVKADGTGQRVKGSAYYDTTNVRVVDEHTVEVTGKKGPKIVSAAKYTASADGAHLTATFTDYPESSPQPITGTVTYTRAGKGKPGAHALTGVWIPDKDVKISENALTVTVESIDGGIHSKTMTGEECTAKFDGKEYPMKNDPGVDKVSLRRVDENTYVETDKKDGKVVGKAKVTVSADGRTMRIVNRLKNGDVSTLVFDRQ